MTRRRLEDQQFTDEELQNLESGKCWCGKPKAEFNKGMFVYCTPEHRGIWYNKTISWQEYRGDFLREHGESCDKCGKHNVSNEERNKARDAFYQNIREHRQDILDAIKAKRFRELEDWIQRQYKDRYEDILKDEYSEYDIEKYMKIHHMRTPKDEAYQERIYFEVDHKLALVNGGKEFDKSNLQVLCQDCHKKKTKSDVRIAKEYDAKAHITLEQKIEYL